MRQVCLLSALCIFAGIASAQDLKVDFGTDASAVSDGYAAYTATHENLASFTAQDFTAFGTTVTVTPTWADGAVDAVAQMYADRGAEGNATDATELTDDWIGTDPREVGNPMTLTLSGVPAGTYTWTSYHHDEDNQTRPFDVEVNDVNGSNPTTGVDITAGAQGVVTLAAASQFTTTITSDGNDITLVFTCPGTEFPDYSYFFVMNGFDLVAGAAEGEGEGEGEGEEPTVADPLKVDFGRTTSAVQDGFQAYTATHEDAGTFTAQDFTALGTTITVTPTWASDAVPAVMQMIADRANGTNDTDATALTDDWIGVDGREAGSPLTLNISGLPAGNYYWLSYHHDEDNQGSLFNATVHDASGTHPTVSVDQTSGSEGVKTLAAVAKFEAFITSDGSSDVKVDFDATGSEWSNFVAVNGIEIHELAEGSSMGSSVNPQFVAEGGTVTLTAPTGSAYRWVMDGVMIAGATDSELTLGPLGADDTGSYWALYEGTGGYFIKTKKFYMAVNAPGEVPVTGLIGLAALMGACGLGGASVLRRRK